jgi:hypothetical protein
VIGKLRSEGLLEDFLVTNVLLRERREEQLHVDLGRLGEDLGVDGAAVVLASSSADMASRFCAIRSAVSFAQVLVSCVFARSRIRWACCSSSSARLRSISRLAGSRV